MLSLLLITWALFAGLLMTRITDIFKLPDVTAYLIVGVLIGPSVLGRVGIEGLGFINFEEVESLSIISDVALGFIAFSIGHEFNIENLKATGKQAVIIGLFEAITATIVVDIALIVVHIFNPTIMPLPMAITLGAIAAATAPAATLMVVKQYKAEGPTTDVLLQVVALDDAIGLMIFAVSFGVAQSMIIGATDVIALIVEPFIEIFASFFLGIVSAIILSYIEKFFKSNTNRLILIIATIILTVAISKVTFNVFGFNGSFSPLLTCMMLGTVFCNICPFSNDLMTRADIWSKPILVLFFVLSGAELDLDILKNVDVICIGFVYIIARVIGKYFGARLGAIISGSVESIKKCLGVTLIPQAGVALGMSSIVARTLGQNGMLLRNIVLFGVLIYELVGPTLTKIALTRAGDIKMATLKNNTNSDFKKRNEK